MLKNNSKYKILKAGDIQPLGWLHEQMHQDLCEGYYSKYESINHSVTHDLFTKHNRISSQKYNRLKCWWSAEHEAYWKDAIIRMAFLTNNTELKNKAIKWVDDILEHLDNDGYIGIYAKKDIDGRFTHAGENGELWTQSRIFQFIIAAYEFTNNKRYLDAVIKAVDLTINKYPVSYFTTQKTGQGGVSHGVGFFDTIYYLFNKTGKAKYKNFALKLYNDFSNAATRDFDLQLKQLLSDKPFLKHGPHVAEGFFIPFFISTLNNKEENLEAASNALKKLKFHITPSGALTNEAKEDVSGWAGTANTAYEYCNISEMVQSYNKVLALTGNLEIADMIETITFNAGQGARLPILKALTYFTRDNRIELDTKEHQGRHVLSATHGAICCVLNGGRLLPYYVEAMWMKNHENNGLTAMLYGASTLNTKIDNSKIKIIETTDYPFSDTISFSVTTEKKIKFPLSFRIPELTDDVTITGIPKSQVYKKDRVITINRIWNKEKLFKLNFSFSVKKIKDHVTKDEKPEYYFKRGPLLFALAFPAKIEEFQNIKKSGFFRYNVTAKNRYG